MSDLPLAPVERIMKKAGIERASPESVQELADTLEEIGTEIARKASELAAFAKRKTVTDEDVKLAAQ